MYLFIFRIWIGYKKNLYPYFFCMDTDLKRFFRIWIILDWILKRKVVVVSNEFGYNFSKMYPYPKSSRWIEQLECGESGCYVAPPSRPHFYRPKWAPEPTPNQTQTPPYPRTLYRSNTRTDTFSKSCIQIHWIQIQHFEFVSNPRSDGYDFSNLYPILNSLDTIFETCIQSGTLWIRF